MIYLQLRGTKSLRGLIDKLKFNPKLQNIINVTSLSQLSRKNASRDYRVFKDLFLWDKKMNLLLYNDNI